MPEAAPPDATSEQARAMWAADAASAALGMRLVELGAGEARVSMVVRSDMVNGHDLCHGGLIASLADSAFALACNSRGPVTVAAGFEIDFLEPARLGQVLDGAVLVVPAHRPRPVEDEVDGGALPAEPALVEVDLGGLVEADEAGRGRLHLVQADGHREAPPRVT
jgi:acyl-CoA thioesterase